MSIKVVHAVGVRHTAILLHAPGHHPSDEWCNPTTLHSYLGLEKCRATNMSMSTLAKIPGPDAAREDDMLVLIETAEITASDGGAIQWDACTYALSIYIFYVQSSIISWCKDCSRKHANPVN